LLNISGANSPTEVQSYQRIDVLYNQQRLRLKTRAFLLEKEGSLAKTCQLHKHNNLSANCTVFPQGAAQRSKTKSHDSKFKTCADNQAETS
jgi:hypothetical protein